MDEVNKVSKFSSGLNIIMRLDILWKNCQNFQRHGKYSSWNNELDLIWLELARDISINDYNDTKTEKGERIEGYESQFNKFDEDLKKTLPFNDFLNGFDKPSETILIKRDKQYRILMKKQLFLARLENKLDKGTTYDTEEEEDF